MKQLEMNLDSSEVAKAKAKVRELAEQHRAERAAERAKPEPSSRPIPTATDPPSMFGPRGGSGSAGGDKKAIKPVYKAGGKVSSKLKSAGFYDKGKTKSEREKIVSKVTTKPQRLGMVEKLFSAKKMKSGGIASKRADGCAIRGKTRA